MSKISFALFVNPKADELNHHKFTGKSHGNSLNFRGFCRQWEIFKAFWAVWIEQAFGFRLNIADGLVDIAQIEKSLMGIGQYLGVV